VLLIPWAMRMNFLDCEIPFPTTQVHHAIVSHPTTHVLELRNEGEHVSRVHRRQVCNSKIGLMSAEFPPGSGNESVQIEGSYTADNEKREQADKQ
jgi:hypothetical protein